ncbi:hypothetical protein G7Y79_00058g091340 [Physcia stellaris]|nr:hypothetical protein G7Y79_00058g091340 [Physcia stellaris]
MHLFSLFNLLPIFVLLFTTLLVGAATPPSLHTSTIYHHPFSASTPTPLATIAFNPQQPHLSTIESFKAPKASKNDQDSTRIAIDVSRPAGEKSRYRTTLVDFVSLKEGRGRFRVSVTEEGELVGVAWHPTVSVPTKEGKEAMKRVGGKGEFDMMIMREGPRATVDRTLPSVKGKKKGDGVKGEGTGSDGEGEEEPEKTFLQK